MADFQLSTDRINQLTFQVTQAIGITGIPTSLDGVSQTTIDGWKEAIQVTSRDPKALPETTGLFKGTYQTVYGWITQQVPTDPSMPPPIDGAPAGTS